MIEAPDREINPNQSRGAPGTVRRRLAFFGVLILLACACGECAARGFWALRGVPPLAAQRMVHRAFYPEIVTIENARPQHDDDYLDVLLLGGSVLHNHYGNIEHLLREHLWRSGRRARVYNAAMPGQTTRDSYLKYRHLKGCQYDVVIIYHGINEVRANNCPPAVFRRDYGHYAWYGLINAWERAPDSRWFVGPFTLRFFAVKAAERLGWASYVPMHEPRASDLVWGDEVKTAASFRENMAGILRLAEARNDPVILMTFSYYIPPDYSRELFDRGGLDYGTHALPIELWGTPKNVSVTIDAHNAVTQELAITANLPFVDQHAAIPKKGRYYNDICHLTHEGCDLFVENLLPILLRAVEEGKHARQQVRAEEGRRP